MSSWIPMHKTQIQAWKRSHTIRAHQLIGQLPCHRFVLQFLTIHSWRLGVSAHDLLASRMVPNTKTKR